MQSLPPPVLTFQSIAALSPAQVARLLRTARESTAATESANRVLASVRRSRVSA